MLDLHGRIGSSELHPFKIYLYALVLYIHSGEHRSNCGTYKRGRYAIAAKLCDILRGTTVIYLWAWDGPKS